MSSVLRTAKLTVLVCVAVLTVGVANASELSKFLHAAFGTQMSRPPSGTEVYYYSNAYRQQGPLESYILMYGSEDYFVNQAQRNMEFYVTRLYQTFLLRNPRPDELRFWVTQFERGGTGNRVTVLRQFCQANHITQLPSFPTNQPVYQVPAAAPAIASELVAKVNLFTSLVQAQLGNSYYGQRVVAQSRSLLSVADQYRQVLQSSNRTSQQVQIAADNVEKSLQALEKEFHRVPGASVQCQTVLQQISQLVTAARTASGGPAPQQPWWGRVPTAPISNATRLPGSPNAIGIDSLLNSVRQFAYGLQNYKDQSPLYSNLYRDVQSFSVQIESLDLMSRQGQRGYTMRDAMTNIQQQARRISSAIGQADMQIQQGWWNVQYQLDQVARTVGIPVNPWAHPSQPVILNRPTWSNFPYQPVSHQPSYRNQEVVTLADQLLSRIDGYVNSLRPVARQKADVAVFVGSLQNLRHAVLALRNVAAAGSYGSVLQDAADRLMTQYQQMSQQATQMIARDPALNSPLYSQIGESIQKIRYAARGVRM